MSRSFVTMASMSMSRPYKIFSAFLRNKLNCVLLIVIQTILVLYFYGRIQWSSAGLEDDVCRSRFIQQHEDYCRFVLRPSPNNYHEAVGRSQQQRQLCPCVPGDIDAAFRVNMNENVTWSELVQRHAHRTISTLQYLSPGGRWTPLWCAPRHRIAIIVPFRGRRQHLTVFINNIHPFLRAQLLDYTIFVVEQLQPDIFNRGALLNVGFLEAKKKYGSNAFDCFIFHDVDLVPATGHNFYVCSPQPRHMAAYRSGWGYEILYEKFFGGVNAFREDHFERINGFSNQFYGWGGEDDDLFHRVLAKDIKTSDRYPRCVSRYAEKQHDRDAGNPIAGNKDLGTVYRPDVYDSDGLNTINYTVVSVEEMQLFTQISVSLPAPPDCAATSRLFRVSVLLSLLTAVSLL